MPHAEEGPWLITAKDIKYGRINYETAENTTSQAYEQLLPDKRHPKLGTVLIPKASLEPGKSISSEFPALCLQSPIKKKIMANKTVKLFDFGNPENNDFLVTNQFQSGWLETSNLFQNCNFCQWNSICDN